MAGADEDDFWDDPEYTYVSGSSSEDHERPLDGLLLTLLGEVAQLRILLTEATPLEWNLAKHRLEALHALVARLPTKPVPQKRVPRAMGFRTKASKK